MKKLNAFLNILIGSSVGVLFGRSLYLWYDYKTHPVLYALNSAPWYTGLMLEGAVTAVMIAAALIVKFIMKKKTEKKP